MAPTPIDPIARLTRKIAETDRALAEAQDVRRAAEARRDASTGDQAAYHKAAGEVANAQTEIARLEALREQQTKALGEAEHERMEAELDYLVKTARQQLEQCKDQAREFGKRVVAMRSMKSDLDYSLMQHASLRRRAVELAKQLGKPDPDITRNPGDLAFAEALLVMHDLPCPKTPIAPEWLSPARSVSALVEKLLEAYGIPWPKEMPIEEQLAGLRADPVAFGAKVRRERGDGRLFQRRDAR